MLICFPFPQMLSDLLNVLGGVFIHLHVNFNVKVAQGIKGECLEKIEMGTETNTEIL